MYKIIQTFVNIPSLPTLNGDNYETTAFPVLEDVIEFAINWHHQALNLAELNSDINNDYMSLFESDSNLIRTLSLNNPVVDIYNRNIHIRYRLTSTRQPVQFEPEPFVPLPPVSQRHNNVFQPIPAYRNPQSENSIRVNELDENDPIYQYVMASYVRDSDTDEIRGIRNDDYIELTDLPTSQDVNQLVRDIDNISISSLPSYRSNISSGSLPSYRTYQDTTYRSPPPDY